jgi:hypothetical protein
MKLSMQNLLSANLWGLLLFVSVISCSAQEFKRGSYTGLGTYTGTCGVVFSPMSTTQVYCKQSLLNSISVTWPTIFGCDTSGRLELIANQISICDSNYVPILGGDTVTNFSMARRSQIIARYSAMLIPVSTTTYYYFVIAPSDSMLDTTWSLPHVVPKYPADNLLMCKVDKNTSGVWQVTSKRIVLYDRDSGIANLGSIAAVRHGNGSDWWLTIRDFGIQTLVNYVVSASGIQGPFKTTFPTQDWTDDFGSGAQTIYSYDGSKIVIAGSSKIPEIFIADFNRCTGEYSNARVVKVPQDSALYQGAMYPDTILSGAALSPNNRYLYVSTPYRIRQVDLNVPGQYPPFVTLVPADSIDYDNDFHRMQWLNYGQDGNIYYTTESLGMRVNYIAGSNYGYPQCSVNHVNVPYGFLVGHTNPGPNFMLGPDSMLCYPAAIQPAVSASKAIVAPTPSNGLVRITAANGALLKHVQVLSTMGNIVHSVSANNASCVQLHLQLLPKGMYYVRLQYAAGDIDYARVALE